MGVRRPRMVFDRHGRFSHMEAGGHSVLDSKFGPFALPVLFGLIAVAAAVWLPCLMS